MVRKKKSFGVFEAFFVNYQNLTNGFLDSTYNLNYSKNEFLGEFRWAFYVLNWNWKSIKSDTFKDSKIALVLFPTKTIIGFNSFEF